MIEPSGEAQRPIARSQITRYSLLDTIAAPATPAGRSALALVRVSGPEVRGIVRKIAPGLPEDLEPRHPYLASLEDGSQQPIDRGFVTFFAAPSSSTGEDVAEFSIHGNPILVERLLDVLLSAGARLARPGEFTERAFLLGKLDLVEAEAVRDLIDARTGTAARLSARRLSGGLSLALSAVREDLLSSLAALEATLDFAEDIGETVSDAALSKIRSSIRTLAGLEASYGTGRLLSAGCRVVILGRPNAGKSTLFNALLGTARAIVTDVPGTTRDTLHGTIDICGIPVELIDTAGLRDTEDAVERIGVERARQAAETADAVIYVFDAGLGWREEDERALAAIDGLPRSIVANKADTVSASSGAAPSGAVSLCGVSPDAGPALRRLLEGALARDVSTDTGSEVLGSLRQRDLVARAGAAASRALDSLCSGDSPEYAATHLQEALDALADVVGETTSEDVLREIFSTFCIGK